MVVDKLEIATIGFTKTTASGFFDRIRKSGVKKVVDVRLHNTSQLAGFAKAEDLAYFLKEICGADYVHLPILAPTDDILKNYKRDKGDWGVYQGLFLKLMAERQIESRMNPKMLQHSCLLCSEATPHHCHRRLVCDYLNDKWGGSLSVRHL
jgi:uncharacterized protein (DUF488 family)